MESYHTWIAELKMLYPNKIKDSHSASSLPQSEPQQHLEIAALAAKVWAQTIRESLFEKGSHFSDGDSYSGRLYLVQG